MKLHEDLYALCTPQESHSLKFKAHGIVSGCQARIFAALRLEQLGLQAISIVIALCMSTGPRGEAV